MKKLLLAGVLVAVAVAAPAQVSDIQVVRAEFGLFNALETGRPPFIATPVVPLVVGQDYGWVITLRTGLKAVRWREEFTPPHNGRTTVTEREVTLYNGVIFNSKPIAAGDATGAYRVRVSIDGRLVQSFEFRIE